MFFVVVSVLVLCALRGVACIDPFPVIPAIVRNYTLQQQTLSQHTAGVVFTDSHTFTATPAGVTGTLLVSRFPRHPVMRFTVALPDADVFLANQRISIGITNQPFQPGMDNLLLKTAPDYHPNFNLTRVVLQGQHSVVYVKPSSAAIEADYRIDRYPPKNLIITVNNGLQSIYVECRNDPGQCPRSALMSFPSMIGNFDPSRTEWMTVVIRVFAAPDAGVIANALAIGLRYGYTYSIAPPMSVGMEEGGSLPFANIQLNRESSFSYISEGREISAFSSPHAARLNWMGSQHAVLTTPGVDFIQTTFTRAWYITDVLSQMSRVCPAFDLGVNRYIARYFNLSASTVFTQTDLRFQTSVIGQPNQVFYNQGEFESLGEDLADLRLANAQAIAYESSPVALVFGPATRWGATKQTTLSNAFRAKSVRYTPGPAYSYELYQDVAYRGPVNSGTYARINYLGLPAIYYDPPVSLGMRVDSNTIPDAYIQASTCRYCVYGLFLPSSARADRPTTSLYDTGFVADVGGFLQVVFPRIAMVKSIVIQPETLYTYMHFTSFTVSYSTTFTPVQLSPGALTRPSDNAFFQPVVDEAGNTILFNNGAAIPDQSLTAWRTSSMANPSPISSTVHLGVPFNATAIRIHPMSCAGGFWCLMRVDVLGNYWSAYAEDPLSQALYPSTAPPVSPTLPMTPSQTYTPTLALVSADYSISTPCSSATTAIPVNSWSPNYYRTANYYWIGGVPVSVVCSMTTDRYSAVVVRNGVPVYYNNLISGVCSLELGVGVQCNAIDPVSSRVHGFQLAASVSIGNTAAAALTTITPGRSVLIGATPTSDLRVTSVSAVCDVAGFIYTVVVCQGGSVSNTVHQAVGSLPVRCLTYTGASGTAAMVSDFGVVLSSVYVLCDLTPPRNLISMGCGTPDAVTLAVPTSDSCHQFTIAPQGYRVSASVQCFADGTYAITTFDIHTQTCARSAGGGGVSVFGPAGVTRSCQTIPVRSWGPVTVAVINVNVHVYCLAAGVSASMLTATPTPTMSMSNITNPTLAVAQQHVMYATTTHNTNTYGPVTYILVALLAVAICVVFFWLLVRCGLCGRGLKQKAEAVVSETARLTQGSSSGS